MNIKSILSRSVFRTMGILNDYCKLMQAMEGIQNGEMSYGELCRTMNLRADELNELLLEEIGMSGEELFLKYWTEKSCIWNHFLLDL